MEEQAPTIESPKITPIGLSGLLVSFGNEFSEAVNFANLAFREALDARDIVGVLETSNTLVSTFISYDPTILSQHQLGQEIKVLIKGRGPGAPLKRGPRKLWKIPAAFGGENGPQLEEAASLAGVSAEKAVEEFSAYPLHVMSIGFAPGQPYLGALPENWNVPRQKGLTPKVPAGSLVVALRQMVLFTNDTSTGWRLVGQTAFDAFRPDQTDVFRLSAGDQIHFVPVAASDMNTIMAKNHDGFGGASFEMIEA